MSDKPVTVLTATEWAFRLTEAARKADEFLPAINAGTKGPGEVVLVGMLIARAMCQAYPGLPDFMWYAHRIAEIPDGSKVS